MKKVFKYVLLSMAALIVAGGTAFYIWAQQTYEPSQMLQRLAGDAVKEDGWVLYEPEEKNKAGLIIYPGAKVEPEAYSYIAQQLSKQGYVTGIPEVTLNLSMLSTNKAEEMIARYPSVEEWYIGGHSLGGVSAASFVHQHSDTTDGLIFLASYPSSGSDFSDTNVPVLSIYAEKDGLTTEEKINETKELLSSEKTTFYKIEGGNHAQFGIYGEQKGDNKADIPVKEQQDIIVRVILDWLQDR
ncbi:alpha/beta hydrolase [Halobacillus litoralis]|uniref:alpha/beta hydrolase n=1 Tax=Halobacillus litoralis TaxID=45668 RepID=UPI001CFDC24A|nr:alpha/beta hydrolase [Halobacillus litoralis]